MGNSEIKLNPPPELIMEETSPSMVTEIEL